MDRGLIVIATFILVGLSSWLLNDLEVIRIPWLESNATQSAGESIGELKFVKNQVRKRALNQLVWQDGGPSNPIHNKDTVLTLDNSAAIIKLKNDVELRLSENTLVLIETDETVDSEQKIRLKFEQGALSTRRLTQNTKFETNSYTIEAKEGAQIQLRSFSDNVELEVIEGEAEIKSPDEKVVSLEAGTVTQFEEDKALEVQEISLDLTFVGKPTDRVYSHTFPIPYSLKWEGQPDKIVLEKLGSTGQTIPVNSEFSEQSIFLFPGTYYVRLTSENQISEAITIEVRQAPIVHLISPLPRDRRPAGLPVTFQWLSQIDLDKYKIRVFDEVKGNYLDYEADENVKAIDDLNKGSKSWKVIAIDRDGFEVPALYDNRLFITPKPLSAPKIKSPDVFKKEKDKPKEDKSSWNIFFEMFFKKAQAQNSKTNKTLNFPIEINFQWEQVDGADFYIVEVSNEPDFRELIEEKKINSLNYRWITEGTGDIYWRVAGGASDGRMGLFSEPQLLNLKELRAQAKIKEVKVAKSVSVRKVTPKPTPAPTPVPKIVEEPKPQPEEELQKALNEDLDKDNENVEVTQIQKNHRFWFSYSPFYTFNQLRGNERAKADFSGLQSFSGEIGASLDFFEGSQLYLHARFFESQWKEKVLGSTVNTPRLKEQNYSLDIALESKSNEWTYGLTFGQTPEISRIAAELLEFKDLQYFGFMGLVQIPVYNQQLIKTRVALGFGDKTIQFEISSMWKFVIFESNNFDFILEPGVNYLHQFHNNRDGSQRIGVGLDLGIEF